MTALGMANALMERAFVCRASTARTVWRRIVPMTALGMASVVKVPCVNVRAAGGWTTVLKLYSTGRQFVPRNAQTTASNRAVSSSRPQLR